jgi:hypothetical protein
MVLFILFPGHGVLKKFWELDIDDDDKIVKLTFLKNLKKLGDVYTYTPNIYKYNYYEPHSVNGQKLMDNFIEKPISLTLDQFDMDKECKRIYEEVKSYKGKFILIGHSMGGLFANHFSHLYTNRCIKIILIESGILPTLRRAKSKKYPAFNKQQLMELENTIKTTKSEKKYNKSLNTLIDIAAYKFLQFYDNKHYTGKLKLPTLYFDTINITKNTKDDTKFNTHALKEHTELIRLNKNNIKIINFINTDHFPWFNPRYSNEIIDEIKYFTHL